jgi:hypothetical protein
MNGQDTSAAHSALQYIISKAMLEGKTGKTTLEIPMTDMYNEFEGPRFTNEATALVLKLEIVTSWNMGSPEGDLDIDDEGDIGLDEFITGSEDELEDDESEEDSGKGTKNGLN